MKFKYLAHFNSSVNATPALSQSSVEFNQLKSKWINSRCSEIADFPRDIDDTYHRMMDILCKGPKFSEIEAQTLSTLLFSMQEIFTETQVCLPKSLDLCLYLNRIWEFTYVKYPNEPLHRIAFKKDSPNSHRIYFDEGINEESMGSFICFNGEPDLERLMEGEFAQLGNGNCNLRFNDIFRWAWESWRLVAGNKIGEIYPTVVQYMNAGAENNGN